MKTATLLLAVISLSYCMCHAAPVPLQPDKAALRTSPYLWRYTFEWPPSGKVHVTLTHRRNGEDSLITQIATTRSSAEDVDADREILVIIADTMLPGDGAGPPATFVYVSVANGSTNRVVAPPLLPRDGTGILAYASPDEAGRIVLLTNSKQEQQIFMKVTSE